jgi:flagellin
MASVINTNIPSLNAQRNLSTSQSSLATSLQRLSSGLRVNSAKDDAAGLAISERMFAQMRGMNVAVRNTNDGVSLAQTAEGALGKVTEMLQRMRELAVQSVNVSNTDADRTSLDNEYQQLGTEIGRTLTTAQFNGLFILAGDAGTLTFQVGANSGETADIVTTDMSASADVTAVTGTNVATVATADPAIGLIDTALDTVNSERSLYGAAQARFETIVSTLTISVENVAAARSRIIDADYAVETANLTRSSILQQAGTAMLAQANALPNTVLTLLRG